MPTFRSAVTLLATAALLVSAGAAASANPSHGTPGRAATCSLDGAELTASATTAQPLTDLFGDYAATGSGWTGGDSTYSVPLRDGSLAWIFSDTFLGPVNDDGSRPPSTPFLNNSIVLQDGHSLETVTGGTASEPESIVGPTSDGDWHWFGAGILTRPGDLQIGVLRFSRFGEGAWDWGWKDNALVTLDSDTWQVTDIAPLPSAANIQWASWYQRIGGHIYVYGVEDLGAVKYMHVARALGGDLTDLKRWRYWDGDGWSKHETDSVRVMPGVANEYSVAPFRDGYLLVTQDTAEPFSSEIRAYTACQPTGPFTGGTTVHHMPEIGAEGSYGNPNVIAYNAHEHPHLRTGDNLLISYNVNSMNPDDLYEDVSIYHPRFVEIDLDVRTTSR